MPFLEQVAYVCQEQFFLGRRRRRGRLLLLAMESADRLDHKKDGGGNDEKVDDRVDEQPVVDGGRASLLCRGQAVIMLAAEIDEQAAEVHIAHQHADRGHHDVGHERTDNSSESPANDDTDGQIHNVSAHDEFFEFFQHGCLHWVVEPGFGNRQDPLYSTWSAPGNWVDGSCTLGGKRGLEIIPCIETGCNQNCRCRNRLRGIACCFLKDSRILSRDARPARRLLHGGRGQAWVADGQIDRQARVHLDEVLLLGDPEAVWHCEVCGPAAFQEDVDIGRGSGVVGSQASRSSPNDAGFLPTFRLMPHWKRRGLLDRPVTMITIPTLAAGSGFSGRSAGDP